MTEQQEKASKLAQAAMPVTLTSLEPHVTQLTYKATGTIILYSYGTPVAILFPNTASWYISPSRYSTTTTTTRHINHWAGTDTCPCATHLEFCDLLRQAAKKDAETIALVRGETR